MNDDVEQIADLVLEAAGSTAGRDRVFVERLAWRLRAENRALFDRAGISLATVAELLWDEFGAQVAA